MKKGKMTYLFSFRSLYPIFAQRKRNKRSNIMEIANLLDFARREQLYDWLKANHATAKECWVTTNRTKSPRNDAIPYVEVVETALCFGWIDSTYKRLPDGRGAQRLSPRRKGSHWTELNIERCHKMIAAGLMTEAGLKAMPINTKGQ